MNFKKCFVVYFSLVLISFKSFSKKYFNRNQLTNVNIKKTCKFDIKKTAKMDSPIAKRSMQRTKSRCIFTSVSSLHSVKLINDGITLLTL